MKESFTQGEIIYILNNIIAQLIAAKSKNVCHRDLKPGQIIINFQENKFMIMD